MLLATLPATGRASSEGRLDPETLLADAKADVLAEARATLAKAEGAGAASEQAIVAREDLALAQLGTGDIAAARHTIAQAIALRRDQLAGADGPSRESVVENIGWARGVLAEIMRVQGDKSGAEAEARAAAAEVKTLLGNDGPDAIAVRNIVGYLKRDGNYGEAHDILFAATVERLKTRDWSDLTVQTMLGDIAELQSLLGRNEEAAGLWFELQQYRAERYGENNSRTVGTVGEIGAALVAVGRNEDALAILQLAREKTIEARGVASTLLPHYILRQAKMFGSVSTSYGDSFLMQSLSFAHLSLGDDVTQLAPFYSELSAALIKRRDYTAARRSLAALINALPEGSPELGRAHVLYGQLDSIEGADAAALADIRATLRDAESLRGGSQIDALSDLASILRSNGKNAAAEEAARESLRIAEMMYEVGDLSLPSLRNQLAGAILAQDRPEEALEVVRPVLGREILGSPIIAARSHAIAAQAKFDIAAEQETAIDDAVQARKIVQTYLGLISDDRQTDSELVSGYRNWRFVWRLEADAYWERVGRIVPLVREPGLIDLGLDALEQAGLSATDRAVGEAAMRAAARRSGGELGALSDERDAALAEYDAAYEGFLATLTEITGAAAEQRMQFQERMEAALKREAVASKRLAAEMPEYAQLRLPPSVKLAEAQALLAEGEAILMLVPSERGTHILAFDAAAQVWTRAEIDDQAVAGRVRSLQWDVGAPVVAKDDAEQDEWLGRPTSSFDRTSAHELYQALIRPAEEILQGKRRVFVVATGSLSTIPLSILVTEPPTGDDASAADLRATRWLGDQANFVMLPSLHMLAFLRRYPAPADGAAFVGFGDPALAPPTRAQLEALAGLDRGVRLVPEGGVALSRGGALGMADPAAIRKMASLPGTALELKALARAYAGADGGLFMQDRATETAFKGADLTRLDVLALATHGLVASEAGELGQPGLVFTPPAVASVEDDGYLTAAEIAGLRIEADWVILSACNTAAGEAGDDAPGLSGLGRAFILAGSRNLLVSHWPVLDAVAPRLTVGTVTALRDRSGIDRGEALRIAMQAVRNDTAHDAEPLPWSHPRVWAPFSLVGEGGR